MKLLWLIALLGLGFAIFVILSPPPPLPPVAVEEPAKVEPTPEVVTVEPVKRTIEEIRADVASKTATVQAPVVSRPDPSIARNARRAEFMSQIAVKRSELSRLDSSIAMKRQEVSSASAKVTQSRRRVSAKGKQWRYVVGGKLKNPNLGWSDISTLPSRQARAGRTVRYRDVPTHPNAPAELKRAQSHLSSLQQELFKLRNDRMRVDSDIANLGLQMNMGQ